MHSSVVLNPIIPPFNPREGMHRRSAGTVIYDSGGSKESAAAAEGRYGNNGMDQRAESGDPHVLVNNSATGGVRE